jgi:hypothetical protein
MPIHVLLNFVALWSAASAVLEGVNIRGCSFHWSQSVIRKIGKLGLASNYNQQASNYEILRNLLALQFLPAEHIPSALEHLTGKSEDPRYLSLCAYIKSIYLERWTPEQWSAYGQAIRTNNDVEGWHHHLNSRYA